MVIVDLIGWITFFLLVIGAAWAAWRVWGDLRQDAARTHEQIRDNADDRDSASLR